jgi:hypothetical protein
LPVHWGTFNLAMHAWHAPAETLIEKGRERGVQLVMPRLGEAVEPSRVHGVEPWWRPVAEAEAEAAEKGTPPAAHAEAPPEEEPPSVTETVAWPLD